MLNHFLQLWNRLLYYLRRDQFDHELAEEMKFHLELKMEENLQSGMKPAEARSAAQRQFGNQTLLKEVSREMWRVRSIETLFQDLRYGLRVLLKQPSFTCMAVLTLALGIGSNTAIFSLLDAVLLKMLPVKNPERLVFLERIGGAPLGPKRSSNLSYAFFEQLRARHEALAGVCTFFSDPRINVGVDGKAEVANGQRVSGSFFVVLGVNAVLGRTIIEADDKIPGADPVVVISYHYWERRFARDPAIVGKSITLNGHPFTIIGVTPPDFFGVSVGEAPDLWTPTTMYTQLKPGESIEEYFNSPLPYVLARLKPEVTEQQARAMLTGFLQQSLMAMSGSNLSPENQQSLRQQSIVLTPASQGLSSLRAQFSEPLRILMAVVGLILLIACANVANLLLARATARQKEIAVRLALGASRFRLIRQLLTEGLLLALTGGALGLLFAWWSGSFLLALVGSGRNPVFLKLTLDARVLSFTMVASVLAGILFGLAPAWRATRVDLTPALKDSARSVGGGSRLSLGKAIVVTQVTLSLLLLIGAGLFVRSLVKLKSLDAGFNQENVLLVSTDPRLIGYRGRQIADLYQRLLERIKAIPGVRSASRSREGLLGGNGSLTIGRIHVQGQPALPYENTLKGEPPDRTPVCEVGPEYFETVGMTILRGRGLIEQDNEKSLHAVAVVNETFARYYFGTEDPIGRRFGFRAETRGQIEIVGVVKDAKYDSLREPARPTYYVSNLQFTGDWRDMTFQIRTAVEPTHFIAAVRQAVGEVEPNLPLFNIKTLATQIDETLVQERLIGKVSSFFGLLSLLLAAIGMYGIMAYAVSQRTYEIGIRMALGAQRNTVLRMILWQGMKMVLIGVGLGLLVSMAGTRIIANQLFGITPTDSMTFVGVPLLLLMVALLACFVPAHRVTKVDPLVALRYE